MRLAHPTVPCLAALSLVLSACGGGDGNDERPGSAAGPSGVDPSIVIATGSGVITLPEPKAPFFTITDYGAVANGPALANQTAINAAIAAAATAGGGTVVVPEGVFKTYSIRLKSKVGLHLATSKSILRAAVAGTGAGQDGGFYDAREPNLYVGLQDQGHSHFANSLVYGIGVDDVMISGLGLIDGGNVDASGNTLNVLSGNDPPEVTLRTASGTPGGANKAIALKDSTHIVFRDFSIRNGGHFAIIGSGVVGWTIDGIVVDTNRDAIDIDSTQNLSVRHSTFNSLTDDAIVLKGSFGDGRFMPTQNVLIEDCTVSGYDAGSVLDGTFSANKIIATDRDGPTARIKLGTEGTTGFNTVTVRNVTFDRSRGFALEAVDGAELRDIVFTGAKMRHITSSPIFIRLGDRGRIPVTGNSSSEATSPTATVRLDDRGWVLPNLIGLYGSFPTVRTIPSYTKTMAAPVGGQSTPFTIVSASAPTVLNPNSLRPTDPLAANAVGGAIAQVRNISIDDVTIEDADPRYPILIAGLVDHPVQNVRITNVSVEYRGGLKMEHAVDQRQLNQDRAYTAWQSAPATQSLPWLVNTFFSKNEALLPRIAWNATANAWEADPYNVPEMPREYPEPSLFGILPAYGVYARHVSGLVVANVRLKVLVEDERPAVVLDDADGATFTGFSATIKTGVPVFVKVTNTKKRPPNLEYVKEQAYKTTGVTNLVTPTGLAVAEVQVARPAPGTPPDSLYALPTAPSASAPYAYAVADAAYPRPPTVFRPYFDPLPAQTVQAGRLLQFTVHATAIAPGSTLTYSAPSLPSGATFDAASATLSWRPTAAQPGSVDLGFQVDDGVLPVRKTVRVVVTPAAGS